MKVNLVCHGLHHVYFKCECSCQRNNVQETSVYWFIDDSINCFRLTDLGSVNPADPETVGLSDQYTNEMTLTHPAEYTPSDSEKLATPFPDYGTMTSQSSWLKSSVTSNKAPGLSSIVADAMKMNLKNKSLDESGDDLENIKNEEIEQEQIPAVALNIIPETPEVDETGDKDIGLDVPEINVDLMTEDPACEALANLTQSSLDPEPQNPPEVATLKPSSAVQVQKILTSSMRTVHYGSYSIQVPSFDVANQVDMKNLITEEDIRNTPSSLGSRMLPQEQFDRGSSSSSSSRSSSMSSLADNIPVSYDYSTGVNNNDTQRKNSRNDISGSHLGLQNGKAELSPSGTLEKSPSRTKRKLSSVSIWLLNYDLP